MSVFKTIISAKQYNHLSRNDLIDSSFLINETLPEEIPCETYFSQELGVGCKKDLQIKELEQKLAKAVECLKFYADESNWDMKGEQILETYDIEQYTEDSYDDYGMPYEQILIAEIAGKRARQILKELGEL